MYDVCANYDSFKAVLKAFTNTHEEPLQALS